MVTYLFGFGDQRWSMQADDPTLAKVAIHEHFNTQANATRPILIYAMNDLVLDEEKIIYYPTQDDLNNLVRCDYKKFCDDNKEQIKQIMLTIKQENGPL